MLRSGIMAKAKKSTKSTKPATVKAVKSAPVAKKSAKKAKKVELKHFKISREPLPFLTFKITEQTVYWFVVVSLIFCLALWVLDIQIKTSAIIDTINTLR